MIAERPRQVTYSADAMRVELRAAGIMRFVGAAVLLLWLCGWAVGEAFAINLLLAFLGIDVRVPFPLPIPSFGVALPSLLPVAFLLVWVVFWTWAGIASIAQVLLLLFGSDTIEIAPSHWSRTRSYGLFQTTRRFDRGDGWSAEVVRKTRALVARRGLKRKEISALGTPAERQWIANEIIRSFGAPQRAEGELPEDFEAVQLGDGVKIVPTRRGAAGCGMLALLIGPGALTWWLLYARDHHIPLGGGTVAGALFAAVMLLAGLWTLLGRQYWIVRRDYLARHLTFPGIDRVAEFRASSLDVEMHTDSDGDEHFTLFARDAANRRQRVQSAMNDAEDVVAFAKFLEKQTGWRLVIAPGIVSS